MAKAESRTPLSVEDYAAGILAGNRSLLARAITLIESRHGDHRRQAEALLQHLLPKTGRAHRIGVTGAPGAGKSTLIDRFGLNLIEGGHKVAVLTVDPTSSRTGGSILGDKTRMARLAQAADAYIRPSPSAGALGGVAHATRETIALVEAAGFDIVVVETIGVGQAETAVAEMVDVFLLLVLPGAGDELQGLKKGVVELADILVVTKADGDNQERARRAAADLQAALHILSPASPDWSPPVLTVSARDNRGLDALWAKIEDHRRVMMASGEFDRRRRRQAVRWLHEILERRLKASIVANPKVTRRLAVLERRVEAGKITPSLAAEEIAALLGLPPP